MLKSYLKNNRAFQCVWKTYRCNQLQGDYRKRRDYYHHMANKQGVHYNESEIVKKIRLRLSNRGYSPPTRNIGQIHTFAIIPNRGWHIHLLPDLKSMGRVTWFHNSRLENLIRECSQVNQKMLSLRKELNDQFISALEKAQEKQPVDWIFVYANGRLISGNTIKKIRDKFGLPIVNMCFDDKQSWVGRWMGDNHSGQIDIAKEFDVSWTSSRVVCEWYLLEGARPIYMPEGFDEYSYKPLPMKKDIPVSFVGGAYGFRPQVARYLKKYGIPLHTFGLGWRHGGWVENVAEIFNRSCINLGMGGIGYSEILTNVKGRDFEIPGTGGGVYLTSYNPDLAQHFDLGREILCYRNRDEMVELIRYYLRHKEEATAIAGRGRARCLKDHRWLHRYEKIGRLIGIFENSS